MSYCSASMQLWIGMVDCVSIICCVAMSSICTMSGRSPLVSPALYFSNASR